MTTAKRSAHQLPPGRHGLPAGYITDHQRARILGAAIESVGADGYADTTVQTIIARAGVSRRTFYEHFPNKEEAFLAAYDDVVGVLITAIRHGARDHQDFARRVIGGLDALLRLIAAHGLAARACVVEVLAAGPRAIGRRHALLAAMTGLIEESARDCLPTLPAPTITAETVVGGIFEVIYNRVLRYATDELPALLPDLAYCVLVPYLGQEEAARRRADVSGEREVVPFG